MRDDKPVLFRSVDRLRPGARLRPAIAHSPRVHHGHNGLRDAGQLYYTVGKMGAARLVRQLRNQDE